MEVSGIVTLLTDFGLGDPYVAMMKGVILSINRDARLIDVGHQIQAGSIMQAAGFIEETFPYFPRGTVHVAVVDPTVGSDRRPIGIEAAGHLFVGPDNGIFWPVMEDHHVERIIHLTEESYFLPYITHTFHGREIFAPVAAHLSSGRDLGMMGSEMEDPARLRLPTAGRTDHSLIGRIIRIDNFGNLITNIHQSELESFLGSALPVFEIGNLTIGRLSRIYADGKAGEFIALINSSGLLEIAINQGRADRSFGVPQEEIVGIEIKVIRSV